MLSVRSDDGTLIMRRENGALLTFAGGDKLERNGLLGEEHAPAELIELLRALPAPPARNAPPERLTEEQLETLRSLGYLR